MLVTNMNRYHCPFCIPNQQSFKLRSDGVMICANCGDPVIKDYFFKPRRLVSIITILAFIAPWLIIILVFLKSSNKPQQKNLPDNLALLIEPQIIK